jgi:23S rRNA pseudouridine955/2504/2580 synthase/23S rRNA pseudouridine1911/1915/1917 synthase
MQLKEWIVYENDDLIAINKPSGLLSIPDREGKDISLKVLLQEKFGHVLTVHRLDRETSGIIVFAKHESIHRHLSMQFEERKTEKIYVGLIIGSPPEKKGSISSAIAEHSVRKGLMVVHHRGKESLTDYEVTEDFRIYSFLRFRIHTGRTHQIRVHMKEMGHPVVCDELYGDGKPVMLSAIKKKKFKLSRDVEEERPMLSRLGLHAFELKFHDLSGKVVELSAAIQKDMRATLEQLRKWRS